MKRLIIILSLLGLAYNAISQIDVIVPMTSKHFCHTWHNEINPGCALEHHITDKFTIQYGLYYNSYERVSFYTGFIYEAVKIGNLTFGPGLLTATGYRSIDFPIMPIPGIYFKYQIGKFSPRIYLVPHKEGMLAFQLGYRIK